MTDAITDIDIREKFGDVDQQGRRPTCLAFAASAAHRHHHGAGEPFCIEWLYYYAVTRAGDSPHAGSRLPETQSVIREVGQPLESHWPYTTTKPSITTWIPPTAPPENVFFAKDDGARSQFDNIARALEVGIPTVIGLMIGESFINVTMTDGFALVADGTEPVKSGAGHALLVVGSGLVDAHRRLLVRNSWGPRWGDLGHAWISEEYLNTRWIGGFRLKEK